jgi:hypothetical protein
MATSRIAAGFSGTNWQAGGDTKHIYIDVDTSPARFNKTPVYVASLLGLGDDYMSLTTGASIYHPTATGVRIVVRWADATPMSPADAASHGWYVGWHGIED